MRALIVMPVATRRGGAEHQLAQLVEFRSQAGIEPTIAFLQHGPMVDWVRDRGVAALVLDAGRLRHVRRLGATVRTLSRLAAGHDVVIGWMATGQVYAGLAALGAGVPNVWLQPGTPTGPAPIERIATALPTALVVTVSRTVDAAQRGLRPRRRTEVVYPAVDTARFDPDRIGDPVAVRRRLGLRPGVPIFGSVGRLDSWKGFGVLLEAVPRVVERHPDATFVLVGGPHDLNPGYAVELRAAADRIGLDGQVLLVGEQPNPEEWMQAMDVFVHCSEGEPFGMVVIEAMALGKAVVASAEGGPTEIVTPGVDGLLAPYGDRDTLAAAIVRYLDDAGLRARVGAAARRRASDFAVEQFARRFGEVVQRATA